VTGVLETDPDSWMVGLFALAISRLDQFTLETVTVTGNFARFG